VFGAAQVVGLYRVDFEAQLRFRHIPIYRPTVEDIADEEAALRKLEA